MQKRISAADTLTASVAVGTGTPALWPDQRAARPAKAAVQPAPMHVVLVTMDSHLASAAQRAGRTLAPAARHLYDFFEDMAQPVTRRRKP